MRVPRTSTNFKYEFIEFKKFYNINKRAISDNQITIIMPHKRY